MSQTANPHERALLAGTGHEAPVVRADAARWLGMLAGVVHKQQAVDALDAMLEHDRRYSKITAVYALGQFGGARAAKVLRGVAHDPNVFDMPGFYNHDMIRLAAALALLWSDDDSGLARMDDLLHEGSLEAYLHLGPAICRLPDTETTRPLREKITVDWLIKRYAKQSASDHGRIVECMAHLPGNKPTKHLTENLDHRSRYVRAQAAQALLHRSRSRKSIDRVEALLGKERTPFARLKIAGLLHEPGNRRAPDTVRRHLNHDDFFIRATALDVLGTLGESRLIDDARAKLEDPHPYVRLCAGETLATLDQPPTEAQTNSLSNDPSPRVRLAGAYWSLQSSATRLSGRY